MEPNGISEHSSSSSEWHVFGHKFPKSEVQYFVQMLLIFIVVITSIYNLTFNQEQEGKLWTALLSSSLGYTLPNPKIKVKK